VQPETKYARSGDVAIAYQVVGDGPIDLVMAPGWIFHLEVVWEQPSFERMIRRFLPHFRVILFDKRGTGLSDRNVGAPTMEDRMDDVRAVMDEVGSERAAIFGWSEGGTIAAMFGATYPERTRALILYSSLAKMFASPDFPMGFNDLALEGFQTYLRESWGSGLAAYFIVPSRANDEAFRRWFGRYERLSLSPTDAVAIATLNAGIDARHIMPAIRVPTLVLHQRGDLFVPVELGRDLAARIDGAKFVELPGSDHLFWFGDPDALVDEVLEFVTGSHQPRDVDRVLATVLFADIVGSTQRASELGDSRWRELLGSYYAVADREIDRFRGRKVKSLGDGILATFDGPARGIRCAQAMASATFELGLEIRVGLHTGEVEMIGDDVGGIAVHIGSRVTTLATPREILVSSTVKDLVVGSGISFVDKGAHVLKGVPDEWRLFAVAE
jgi:pimeloyl-ACP methyl ester carboxylesterase